MGPAFVETLPVAKFHGIGPVTAAKMQRLGIASDRAKPLTVLRHHFGKSAAWYQAIAHGEDDRPVSPIAIASRQAPETTFERDLTEPAEIEAGVRHGR